MSQNLFCSSTKAITSDQCYFLIPILMGYLLLLMHYCHIPLLSDSLYIWFWGRHCWLNWYICLGYTAFVTDWRNTVYMFWKVMEWPIEILPNSCISNVITTPLYLQTLLIFIYEYLIIDSISSWLDLFFIWSPESILSKYLLYSS